MTSKIRLISGRIPVTNAANVTSDRYEYLDLASAEPNLGVAANGYVLAIDTSRPGYRSWIDPNQFAGVIGFYAFSKANAANILAQAAFNTANSAVSNTIYTQLVDNYQNNQIAILQSGLDTANANIALTIGVDAYQNNRMSAIETVDNNQNTSISIVQGGLNTANANIALTIGVDASQNTRMSNIETVNTDQNTNIAIVQGGLNTANANIALTIGVDSSQNTRMSAIETVNTDQNTAISLIQGVDSYQNTVTESAFTKANNALPLTGGTLTGPLTLSNNSDLTVTGNLFVTGNTFSSNVGTLEVRDTVIVLGIGNYSTDTFDIGFAGHYNNGTNAHTGLFRDSDTKEWHLFEGYTPEFTANNNINVNDPSFKSSILNANVVKANLIATSAIIGGADFTTVNNTQNNNIILLQGGLNTANANIALTIGVNSYQNTQISLVSNVAQNAYDKANASYDFANNISSSLSGNSIVLGTNTSGLLVSNAVSLTPSTYITNGIAQINQILGKLVPSAPATFPSTYGTLTINSVIGPYRMTNFSQTDNTGTGTASVTGGTSVSPLRVATYTTSTITNINTLTGDVISVIKNAIQSGTRTITSGATNAGTYNDLVILNNVDYATVTGIAANFWYSANLRASGTVSAGWNNVSITDTAGTPTANATWYYDNSAPGSPTFTSASIVPLSTSLTYSSTIPHYNSSTTFKLGVNVSKLSGDMFPASNTFFTGTAGGAFGAPASNTYPAVGITYPLARNLYVSSGSVTVNTTSSIVSGFGSSSTGPSVTVDNSYSTASQVFTTALSNTVLYKTGTASLMEETSVTFGTTVGTGSGLAARIINPGTTDTPTYTAGASLFDSQSSTLTANDATIVASTLKHDQTNYSTAYLPVGPNLSTGRTGSQYFTFKFVRTSVSKFDIKYTGTIAGLWVALPGSSIDTTSGINGWMDMSTAYAGSGHPGTNSGGNGSNGCALGGTATLNSLVTNGSYTCTFGDVSSSSTATNEIYVRIKLTSGQTVSALTLQTASH